MKKYYSPVDFNKSPKYDAHIHYHSFDDLFIRKAKKINMRLLSINTDFGFLPIETQFEISQFHHQRYPQTFNFLGSFDVSTFASKTFTEDTVVHIKNCMAAGAKGIKIWKNIGMSLKNDAGQYIMADDPIFDPIFAFLEKEKIPLLAHLGEPHNCWLPLESITTDFDLQYFGKNPDYHMYLHPEVPSYEQHIIARDHILERYPSLIFVGAHLGSMEWNLEEVAKRLDYFPNFYVDIAVQFEHIYDQTIRNRNQVIDFFETFQNRILYGSDYFVTPNNRRVWMNHLKKYFPHIFWSLLFKKSCQTIKNHWLFLSTDKVIKTNKMLNKREALKHVEGLKLPKKIVDRIFYENAVNLFEKQ